MLIATLTTLFLLLSGSGTGAEGAPPKAWFDHALDLVGDHVQDSDRAERARSILEEIGAENESFVKRVLKIRERLVEVDRDYHATREDYRAIYREIDGEWTRKEAKFRHLLFDLREVITPEEWTPLFTEVHRRSE
jgi:hypothetical protein